MKTLSFLGAGDVLLALIPIVFKSTSFDCIKVGFSDRHGNEILSSGMTYRENLYSLQDSFPNLLLYEFNSLDDEKFSDICDSELQISLGSPWIFKRRHIDKSPFLILSHCTELPKYRGGASLTWMIMSNYRRASINLFKMSEGIDSGDFLIDEPFTYPNHLVTPSDFSNYTNQKLISVLTDFISHFTSDYSSIDLTPQDHSSSSYFPRLSSDIHGWIDWKWSAPDIVSFVNAFSYPYSGAKARSTHDSDSVVHILSASFTPNEHFFHPFKSGLVYRISSDNLYVALKQHTLVISDFNIVSDNPASRAIRVGDRLFSFYSDLDLAMSTRSFYKPS